MLLLMLTAFILYKSNKSSHTQFAKVLTISLAWRNPLRFHLPVTHYQHVGNFLRLRFPDLISQLFIAKILLGPDARLSQHLENLFTIRDLLVRHGKKHGLNRRQPDRKGAGMMLYKQPPEPFFNPPGHP